MVASTQPWVTLGFMVFLEALVLSLLFAADVVERWWVSGIFAAFGIVGLVGGYGAIQAFHQANNQAVWIAYGVVTLIGTGVSIFFTFSNTHKFAGVLTSTIFVLYTAWIGFMWYKTGVV